MTKPTKIGEIRAPQLVGMFGPGSIVNLEKLSVMPSGVGRWNSDAETIESPTFAKQIGARRLIDASKIAEHGVRAALFPKTFVCRNCGSIQTKRHISQEDLKYGFRCFRGDDALYPSRWIIYCERGHIDDFDYGYFVHGASECQRQMRLKLGVSLRDTWVVCECGERRSMIDAYGKASPFRRCSGRAPWLSEERQECEAKPKVSMRSASDVYFGAVRSGISIEPESNPLISKALSFLGGAVPKHRESKAAARDHLLSMTYFAEANEQDVDRAVNEFFAINDSAATYRDRRKQEYDALARDSGSPSEDLYVQSVDSRSLRDFGISGCFAVRKLREVRALVAFRRGGIPSDPAFDDVDTPEPLTAVGPDGHFPAYENRGEGIFLTLDPKWVSAWLRRPAVRARIATFDLAEQRWRETSGRSAQHRSRGIYVLTHSFAHLLIRQLALVSGYSQSSLRERIYASEDDSDPWAGMLVYTASSDADGSLGGLVAVATDGRVADMLAGAIESLQVCSSDPVCALQTPKGFRKMNGAACHGCIVLPETCCERNNFFLDRTLVVPDTVCDDTAELCFSKPR